jgi:hypothetical protein
VIIPCIALAMSVATLAFVLWNGRKIKRLQRQTFADLYLAAILNSGTRYHQQRVRELQQRTAELQRRRRR